jgi:flagellar biogenesis protein FliO
MSSYAAYLIETFVTLALVCGVAFAVLFGARKLGLGRATGPIALVGQLPLDGRRVIYLVRVGAQVFVVAAGEGGFTKLGELPADALPPVERAPASPFAQILAAARGPRRTTDAPKNEAP